MAPIKPGQEESEIVNEAIIIQIIVNFILIFAIL